MSRVTATAHEPGPPGGPATRQDAVLSVRNLTLTLTRGRERTPLVEEVSFDVAAGRTLGLVGESGSGKTLTSLALLQLLPPEIAVSSGSIVLDGTDLAGLPEPELRRLRGSTIAMIFQEPMTSLNPAFTIGNQLVEAVRAHRPGTSRADARARAIEVLDLVGIPGARSRLSDYPHNFSGGMRQRAMIALALTGDPAVLVADEPTTALDVTIQAQILELLRRVQRELGMAMVLVTHDLGVVAEVCDDVCVMYAGQVVETGDVESLFTTPTHPYTEGLLRAMPRLAGRRRRLESIPGLVPAPGDHPYACRFAPRCDHREDGLCLVGPLPLAPSRHAGTVRCHRAEALILQGVDQVEAG